MAVKGPPIPLQDPIAKVRRYDKFDPKKRDPQEGQISDPWANWMSQFVAQTTQAPSRVASVSLIDQSASIVASDIIPGNVQGGLYRLSYFAHITQAASVSSSLTVNLSFTSNGNALTFAGSAITGNTTGSYQSSGVGLFNSDDLAPIQYSTTYASVGGTPMTYSFYLALEQVQ